MYVTSWQKLRGENYSTSAMWFEQIISARTFYMASLPEKDAEEDQGDVGLTTSSNGQAYTLQSVQYAKGRSAWRALVSVSVTSDPQS